jgi:hypothetical protein
MPIRPFAARSLLVLVLSGCSRSDSPSAAAGGPATATRDVITGDSIRAHAATLGSDRFQGRAPGTLGDTLATEYIASTFKRLGLEPGMPGGSFRQTAPFWSAAPTFTVTVERGGRKVALADSSTAVIWESAPETEIAVDDRELIFAGYGIDAPEVGWRDYKTPLSGRIVMTLYGEPSRPDPARREKADTTFFLGDELGWYGWLSHKAEAAGAQGVAALLLVIDEKSSGIPWSALQSYARERSHLEPDPKYPKQVPNIFFLNRMAADRILGLSGRRFDDLVKAAGDSSFTPIGLGARISVRIAQRIRKFGSDNVVARITGSDPRLSREAVIYTAHWDHMGIDSTLKGDQIYNGAIDNAVGVAALLEVPGRSGRRRSRPSGPCSSSPPRPRSSCCSAPSTTSITPSFRSTRPSPISTSTGSTCSAGPGTCRRWGSRRPR